MMFAEPLSTDRIRRLAGPLDESTVAEILRLHATEDELVEALGWLDGERGDEPIAHPARARTMALFALLADARDDEELGAGFSEAFEPH